MEFVHGLVSQHPTHRNHSHGPPLVLKIDNGSPFIADHTLRVLLPRDVIAAEGGSVECVEALLAAGSDPWGARRLRADRTRVG